MTGDLGPTLHEWRVTLRDDPERRRVLRSRLSMLRDRRLAGAVESWSLGRTVRVMALERRIDRGQLGDDIRRVLSRVLSDQMDLLLERARRAGARMEARHAPAALANGWGRPALMRELAMSESQARLVSQEVNRAGAEARAVAS